jgi:CXC domain
LFDILCFLLWTYSYNCLIHTLPASIEGKTEKDFDYGSLESVSIDSLKSHRPSPMIKRKAESWNRSYANIEEKHTHVPCNHKGDCDDNCHCRKSFNYCEKLCLCLSSSCSNRYKGASDWYWLHFFFSFLICFLGCNCSGQCTTAKCICVSNKRECDPDYCKCNVLDGNSNKPICKNVNLSKGFKKQTEIKSSTIPNAGWGCFAKEDINKDDFIDVSLT